MSVKCDCEDWESNISTISGFHALAWAYGDNTPIKTFVYCPYCGKKLIEE